MRLCTAVDFDGTITIPECYPDIGQPNEAVIKKLRQRKKEGRCIIINTCRIGEPLERMKAWLDFFGVPYDYINENDPERIAAYGGDCRKISADEYIDDKAMRPEEWVRTDGSSQRVKEQAKEQRSPGGCGRGE